MFLYLSILPLQAEQGQTMVEDANVPAAVAGRA